MRISRKMLMVMGIFGLMTAIVTGAVVAYFSNFAKSQTLSRSTAGLSLEVKQPPQPEQPAWVPGGITTLRWEFSNKGDVSAYVRGIIKGDWQNTELDRNLVKVAAIRFRFDPEEAWQTIPVQDNPNLNYYYYFSTSSFEDALVQVGPGQKVEFEVDLSLDQTADNRYQLSQFDTSLEVYARQASMSSHWPPYVE